MSFMPRDEGRLWEEPEAGSGWLNPPSLDRFPLESYLNHETLAGRTIDYVFWRTRYFFLSVVTKK